MVGARARPLPRTMIAIAILMSAAILLAAGRWWWRRREVASGFRCWNCGANLRVLQLHIDPRGQERCPKCGDLVDEGSRTYRLPRS